MVARAMLDSAIVKGAKAVGEGIGKNIAGGAAEIGEQALNYSAGVGQIVKDNFIRKSAEEGGSIFSYEFNKKGKTLVFGAAAVAGVFNAKDAYDERQMGMPSGEVASPVPEVDFTRFGSDAGATGDLVFALNRNRRG